MDETNQFLDDLQETGADLRGHFLLTTGFHSPRFFLMARLTEHPERLRRWGDRLAELLSAYPAPTVVGPAVGGILPAYAVAVSSHRRVLYAEKRTDGDMALYPGALAAGEHVIVIEDAVATGSSVRKVIKAVEQQQAIVDAVATLIHRGASIQWTVPYHSVVALPEPVAMWLPADCPLCQSGLALTRPKA
jgi:orotate phosphoribosyltransferase